MEKQFEKFKGTHPGIILERELNLKRIEVRRRDVGFFTGLRYTRRKKKQANITPDLSLLRQSLFWNTDINRIDWSRQYIAFIEKVFERGNSNEKDEVTRFYGKLKSVIGGQGKKLP